MRQPHKLICRHLGDAQHLNVVVNFDMVCSDQKCAEPAGEIRMKFSVHRGMLSTGAGLHFFHTDVIRKITDLIAERYADPPLREKQSAGGH